MRPAARVEPFSLPPTPALLQAEPRDPRHEIELARPRVPLDDRIQADARRGEGYVALLQHLCRRVVAQQIEPVKRAVAALPFVAWEATMPAGVP